MSKGIAMMVAAVLAWSGLIAIFVEGRHFLLFNVDFPIDLMYLGFAAIMFYVSRERAGAALVRAACLLVGVVLVGVGLIGLADRQVLGLAPLGLQPLDFLLFWGLGGAALIAAVLPRAEVPIWDVERERTPVQESAYEGSGR